MSTRASGGTLRARALYGYTQTRAADTLALGIFEGTTLELPKPGAPEILGGLGCAGTCGCAGACGHKGVGDISATIAGMSTPVKVAAVVGLYFLYKKMKKRR